MSDKIVRQEMLEALRSDWGRLRHQRAKLEKKNAANLTKTRLGREKS